MALVESLLHRLYAFLFSPEGGGWGYPYLGLPGLEAVLVVAVLGTRRRSSRSTLLANGSRRMNGRRSPR